MVERRTPKNEEIFVTTKNLLLFNSCPRKISELGPHLTKKAGSAPETPVLESLLNKVSGPQACNFIKKRLQHRCFSVGFAKFLGTPIFIEHL